MYSLWQTTVFDKVSLNSNTMLKICTQCTDLHIHSIINMYVCMFGLWRGLGLNKHYKHSWGFHGL